MGYLPKSKYKVLKTSGNDLQLANGQTYQGPYIETSTGLYAGDNPYLRGPKLFYKTNKTVRPISNILENEKTHEYYKVKPSIVSFIGSTKPIVSTKTIPQSKDYDKGIYIRYFAKKVNTTTDYFEINKITYDNIKSKNVNYDHFSYGVGKIVWALDGDTEKINGTQLQKLEQFYPNISSLFPNVNEFNNVEILTDQQAKPGELVFFDDNNREYIGPYHVHPSKGPMVGAKHTSSPHPRLIFVEDLNKEDTLYKDEGGSVDVHSHDGNLSKDLDRLYVPDPIDLSQPTSTYNPTEDILKNLEEQGGTPYTPPTSPSTPSTPSTPSYSGGSSGGGGGGY